MGARGGVPAEQPLDYLPGRSDDDESNGSAPLRRSHRRAGLQRGEQDATRRKLGLAPLLSLDVRQRRQGEQRRHATRGPAGAESLALHRLSGLQVSRPAGSVVFGPQHVPAQEGRPAVCPRWFRDRRPRIQPGDISSARRAVDRQRLADDVQPVLDRGDHQRVAGVFHAGGREVDAIHLRGGSEVMSDDLLSRTCTPCRGGGQPLTKAEAEVYLAQAPGWTLADDGRRIERSFKFENFKNAMDFVAKIGNLSESEGHHPDISFGWGWAKVSWQTKKIKGLHENDFIMAAKTNELHGA